MAATHFTNQLTENRRVVQFLHSRNNAPAFKVRITYMEGQRHPDTVTILGNGLQGIPIPVEMLDGLATLFNEINLGREINLAS